MEVHVRKKFAIYIPRSVVRTLELKVGDKLLMKVEKGRIILEKIEDPFKLALSGDYFASVDPKDIERISMEEQSSYVKDPS
ncbi:MAG: hypothetical protein DRZ82_05800 [Thermoprotei archaeon]|nr:MAG: hypothetical protein DRZ82_05800 [Thermoprotei archaeon]